MNRSANNFDGVRIVLAVIVVFAHIGALTQLKEFGWFANVFDSDFAVKGFFAISGFLVTKSYLTSKNFLDYASKRARRIWPAYIAVVTLCSALGACFTAISLSEYFLSKGFVKYMLSNVFFLNFLQPTLPGVFLDNPIPAVNGALWTIKVEVALYCCVPMMAFLWRRNGALLSGLCLILLSSLWVYYFSYCYSGTYGEEIARQFPGQLSYFAAGSLLSMNGRCRNFTKYAGPISVVFLFLVADPVAKLIIEPFAYTAIVIWLSTIKTQIFDFGKYGDLSYGIYLFHFPIIQILFAIGAFSVYPWLGLVAVLVFTIFCAWMSWHFIEKRVLRRSSHYIQAAEI